jgi:hypothetical protein
MLAELDYYGISFVVSDTPLPQTISCNTGSELTILSWTSAKSLSYVIKIKLRTLLVGFGTPGEPRTLWTMVASSWSI